MEQIVVKKGSSEVSGEEGCTLTASSLGAALAVAAADPAANVSGMAVCMLPVKAKKDSFAPDVLEQLRELFKQMVSLGARPQDMLIFLAGAAGFIEEPEEIATGRKLYKTVIKTLRKNGLKIKAEHVGGPINRTASITVGEPHLTVSMLDEREVQLC